MIIQTFVEPPLDNNNYLIIDEKSKEAVLIDCSAIDENIQLELNKHQAILKYILLTHGHFDHISGITSGCFNNAKIVINKEDVDWVKSVNRYLPMFGMAEISIPNIDIFISDGDILRIGDIEIKAIHTPGHTQGGICYLIENMLFSGDTIFRESVGRCDLEGGNFNQIIESINNKIFTLSNNTIIYPGHGKITSVEWEKEHNNFL